MHWFISINSYQLDFSMSWRRDAFSLDMLSEPICKTVQFHQDDRFWNVIIMNWWEKMVTWWNVRSYSRDMCTVAKLFWLLDVDYAILDKRAKEYNLYIKNTLGSTVGRINVLTRCFSIQGLTMFCPICNNLSLEKQT